MAAQGVSGDVVDECLNHVIESRVRRTYIRDRRIVQQRHVFDVLGKFLVGLVQTGSPTFSRSTKPLSASAGRFSLPRDATAAPYLIGSEPRLDLWFCRNSVMRPSLAARQTLIRKPASRAGSLQTKLGL